MDGWRDERMVRTCKKLRLKSINQTLNGKCDKLRFVWVDRRYIEQRRSWDLLSERLRLLWRWKWILEDSCPDLLLPVRDLLRHRLKLDLLHKSNAQISDIYQSIFCHCVQYFKRMSAYLCWVYLEESFQEIYFLAILSRQVKSRRRISFLHRLNEALFMQSCTDGCTEKQ